MNKSLYYIECTCIKDCKFPNVEYHIGDIIYFNPKAASNETYVYYDYINKCHTDWYKENHIKYGGINFKWASSIYTSKEVCKEMAN